MFTFGDSVSLIVSGGLMVGLGIGFLVAMVATLHDVLGKDKY